MDNNNGDNQSFFDDATNIKLYFFKLVRVWYLFVIALFLSLSIAFFYLQYQMPVYGIKASLLVKQESAGSDMLPFSNKRGYSGFSQFGQSNLSDEIAILRSSGIIEETVQLLDDNVSYFANEELLNIFPEKNIELFSGHSPFQVEIDKSHPQLLNAVFRLEIKSESSYILSMNEETVLIGAYSEQNNVERVGLSKNISFSKEYKFGEKVVADNFEFTVALRSLPTNTNYSFLLTVPTQVAEAYKNRLRISQENGQSKVLTLSVSGSVPEKDKSFLDKLSEVYLQFKLDEKKKYFNQSIDFIDIQLIQLTDSLKDVEDSLELFRKQGQMMDLGFASTNLLNGLSELDTRKAEIEMKEKYYLQLEKYIKNNLDEDILVPSLIGINEGSLESMLAKYMDLTQKLRKQKMIFKDGKIIDNSVSDEIAEIKLAIIAYVDNLKKSNDLLKSELNRRINEYKREFSKLPAKDRELLNIKRKFELNDNIYTLLLSKRIELGITKAGITSDIQLLEPAKFTGKLGPNTRKIYAIALIIGLGIPLIFMVLMDLLNDKLSGIDELKRMTNIPVIGSVCQSNMNTSLVVANQPKSPVSEMFRSIRMNMGFMLPKNKKTPVIAITSYISGEGKTFVSMNISCTFAFTGKKVVLIGADLRKPKIAADFNIQNDVGLSGYLSGNVELNQIIKPSGYENLDVILSGIEPPNPVELLEDSRMDKLIEELSGIYDYIIIDTAPLGLVSDYYAIMNKADMSIFVVREGYSRKKSIDLVNEVYEKHKIENFSILYNGVKTGVGYGYGYGYGSYGGNGYGYFEKEVKK
ncbi:MAG: tyrosine-protein kinase Etk/Wzc [Bacteroidia bacterium]|jgi:tyrosine-protein kinase Etk/Wzc